VPLHAAYRLLQSGLANNLDVCKVEVATLLTRGVTRHELEGWQDCAGDRAHLRASGFGRDPHRGFTGEHGLAGIGGIGGGGGGGRAHASLDGGTSEASAVHVAALSIIHLQDAIQNGKSEAEIRAMADDAGYRLVIT